MQQDLDSAELPYHVNVNEMTDDEKNLYYFKLHDSDNNDALDGLELIQAATHHAHDKHLPDEKTDEDSQTIAEELTHIIGKIIYSVSNSLNVFKVAIDEFQISSTISLHMQTLTMTASWITLSILKPSQKMKSDYLIKTSKNN